MCIKTLINKVDSYQMAIESTEVLVNEHTDEYLKPTLNYLKEKKKIAAQELSSYSSSIEVQAEEINRLSNI